MEISAKVTHAAGRHDVSVRTGPQERPLAVPAKPAGGGSAVNGGEFLMLALATCYCNDLYREAARLGMELQRVEVEAFATFAGVGLAASGVRYRASVETTAPPAMLQRLLQETDAVAEVHNTLRQGASVTLVASPPPDAVAR